MSTQAKPLAVGAVMGAMLLWMLHGALMEDGVSAYAVAAFIGAHLIVLAVLVTAGLFAARLSPRTRAMLNRLHRPNLSHIGSMLLGMAAMMGAIHLACMG